LKSQVYVAGTGVISAIGNTVSETLESFRHHRSGIGTISHLNTIHQNILPVGEVKLSDQMLAKSIGLKKTFTRTAMLGIHAATQACQQSGIPDLKAWRSGLISATTVGGMDRTEIFFDDFVKDHKAGNLEDVVNHACGKSTELIAESLGVSNFISTINTACSSSVNAIIFGTRLIQHDILDVVIAGGTDALTRFALNGFNSLMILDKEPCRPFDASRSGLNLGEGAGYLVLVSEKAMREEKIRPLCVVSGFANTNDAFHQTASSPEGRGSFAAMQQSLEMSGLSRDDIDYINLHGTGTINNDQSEGTAIKKLFHEQVAKVSSTKSFTGHTLGACGGIEAVFSVLALQHGIVFPNLRFQQPMPELAIIPQTKFEEGLKIRNVMSNSFGFGGNCSSIIFSQAT
jgi:3-oxoacyl-(acyl-carrier-protein) synthase